MSFTCTSYTLLTTALLQGPLNKYYNKYCNSTTTYVDHSSFWCKRNNCSISYYWIQLQLGIFTLSWL